MAAIYQGDSARDRVLPPKVESKIWRAPLTIYWGWINANDDDDVDALERKLETYFHVTWICVHSIKGSSIVRSSCEFPVGWVTGIAFPTICQIKRPLYKYPGLCYEECCGHIRIWQSPADQIIFHENCLYPGINLEQRSFGRGGVRSRRVEDEMFAKKYENVFAKLFRRSFVAFVVGRWNQRLSAKSSAQLAGIQHSLIRATLDPFCSWCVLLWTETRRDR